MGEPPRTGATDRITPSRNPRRASYDLAEAHSILAAALIGHVGAVRPDGTPVVLPVAVAPDGDRVLSTDRPDRGCSGTWPRAHPCA